MHLAHSSSQSHTTRNVLLGSTIALALSALVVRTEVRKVERENPPRGRFIEVDGVRLRVIERGPANGSDEVPVLLHGNGTMALDFELAGLVDAAAQTRRVIAFDRPGFGYSERPRDLAPDVLLRVASGSAVEHTPEPTELPQGERAHAAPAAANEQPWPFGSPRAVPA